MTPAEEESYVREHWENSALGIRFINCSVAGLPSTWHSFDTWHDAYLFTERREAEIKFELDCFDWCVNNLELSDCPEHEVIAKHLLDREQASLEALRRGWKGEACR